FEMQLQLAKEMKLPIIIHTRDGFSDTLECIKNANYDNGIIHCFSYGMEEAMSFLERGWYISFSGAVTYAKKNKIEQMHALLKSIPKEKILLETDSPYLAPVPFRGKLNTPVLVEHVYKFVADSLGLEAEELSSLVDENCKKLFSLL
ncbi:MAG: TatD family hydrolase, partial [Treponema sp.]|nr:TatD family hydrolase [Treponema sp.]